MSYILSPFIPVQSSFWPFLLSLSLFSLMSTVVLWTNIFLGLDSLLFNFILVVLLSYAWWKDLSRERNIGYHTHKLEVRLRVAMLLFILSEVFFFVSFFWAFYDRSLSPSVELGIVWPPVGILPLSVYSVPLLNTVILLSSGVSITWSHHCLTRNLYSNSVFSLAITILLGIYFLIMQYEEYSEAPFALSDGVYGRTFFVRTGFHGVHVCVGTLILIYSLVLIINGSLSKEHHFTFEARAWYWHFVDVVWLFLFISIYWWGSLRRL